MIRDEDVAILAELSRIVRRFGPDSVMRLARLIADPETAENISLMLERVASSETAIAKPSVRKRSSKARYSERVGMAVLNELRLSDPRKHAVLAQFRELLLKGDLLHSMSEVRRFASNSRFGYRSRIF